MLAVFIALAAYIIYDVLLDYPQNAISVAGLALYIIIFYVFSKNPAKVFIWITFSQHLYDVFQCILHSQRNT